MQNSLWIIIVGMFLVTYLPKVIPFLFLKDRNLPQFIQRFLQYIIFAILGSLIFPGILTSTNNIYSAIFGGICAIFLSIVKLNITIVILGTILSVYFFQYIQFL